MSEISVADYREALMLAVQLATALNEKLDCAENAAQVVAIRNHLEIVKRAFQLEDAA